MKKNNSTNNTLFIFSIFSMLVFCLGLSAQNQIGFIENKGQIVSQNYEVNWNVKYLLNDNGMNVQLRQTGFSYDTYTDELSKEANPVENHLREETTVGSEHFIRHFQRVDVEFRNCNPHPLIVALAPSSDYLNYFTAGTPAGGISHVSYYQHIIYKDIYPNIDVEFFANEENSDAKNSTGMKYNFIVHPGGNIHDIQLEYQGAADVSLNDGQIQIKVSSGVLTEELPRSYLMERNENIDVDYSEIAKNIYGFVFKDNPTIAGDLIIDPVPCLLWGSYYGGSGNESVGKLKLDLVGNIYLAGLTTSASNIATVGAYQATFAGSYDGFITKFDPTGLVRLWSTYYGGSGDDPIISIAVNSSNEVYAVGYTTSASNISTVGAYQTSNAGGYSDAFIAKFDSTGSNLLWATYYGGAGEDAGLDIAIDTLGNSYITGYTGSISGISTSGAFDTTLGGSWDAFFAKINPIGNGLIWGTYYGSNGEEDGSRMRLDSNNDIIGVGITESTFGIASSGAYQTTYGGGTFDGMIVKLNQNGNRLWATYYGGPSYDVLANIEVDQANNIFVVGHGSSTSGIATPGTYQEIFGGWTYDAYVAKFNSSGTNLIWGTYYGGTGDDRGKSVAVDSFDNVYVEGYTFSTDGISTANAYQPVFAGGPFDSFIGKINSSGTSLLWGTYYGGAGTDYGKEIVLGNNNNFFVGSSTNSTNGISTSGAYDNSLSGIGDGYFAEFGCSITGMNEVDDENIFTVFPNPSEGTFTLSTRNVIPEGSIEIFNVLGEKIYGSQTKNQNTKIDLASEPSGIYFYRVLSDSKIVSSGKLIRK